MLQLDHTHALDWDRQRQHDADEDRHAHRNDLTPAMIAADPRFGQEPGAPRLNRFYGELLRAYPDPAVVACLWATAQEIEDYA